MSTETSDLISKIESLPVDIKTKLIEKLLNSLHPSQKEIDELWVKEAKGLLKLKPVKSKPYPEMRSSRKFRKNIINEILFPSRSKGRVF
jgi:hypothetical protein